eukprot:1158458-Pelagomonas_calceolata.AAC.8
MHAGRGDSTASDQMSDILAQVASNVDASRNAGNAVLYECVQVCCAVRGCCAVQNTEDYAGVLKTSLHRAVQVYCAVRVCFAMDRCMQAMQCSPTAYRSVVLFERVVLYEHAMLYKCSAHTRVAHRQCGAVPVQTGMSCCMSARAV